MSEGPSQAQFDKAYFGRRYALSASHRLHSDSLSPEENREAYGKCNNPYGHGHNYVVEVVVGGAVDPETGMVVNMATLDEAVRREILERFDHTNLNLDPVFVDQVPTTENLARAVFGLLHGAIQPAWLEMIRIEETENNFFEYAEVAVKPF
jgi:6-pyruvoyltetrahydropterin/6-carboxytetrahydropterin synthase